MIVYPLKFVPIFKPRIWGGRRLESVLGKKLQQDAVIGESWEIADLEDDQSIVHNGPLRGKPLGEIMKAMGSDLLGRSPLFEGRFPLLIKFLDAQDMLSVQVHPDAATAKRLGGRVRVKNEAWYVVATTDDGCIYRGLKDGVDQAALRRAIEQGCVESVLNKISARPGHCYYLPSGTLHALGAGVLVAEVQTPSDITYRVFDWNRVDPSTGSQRELHLEQALGCINFGSSPIDNDTLHHTASLWTTVTNLVQCESFLISRVRMVEGAEQAIPYQEMVIWMVLEGRGEITCDGLDEPVPFETGDTVLLPAAMKNPTVRALVESMWLEVAVPIESSLKEFERPSKEELRSAAAPGGGLVQLSVKPTDAQSGGEAKPE